MPTPILDQVLKTKYVVFSVPADKLLCDPEATAEFCDVIRGASSELAETTNAVIAKRLLQLRKLGQDRGGLPRLGK